MVLVVKPEGMRPLDRPRHKWEGIKLGLLQDGAEETHVFQMASTRQGWG